MVLRRLFLCLLAGGLIWTATAGSAAAQDASRTIRMAVLDIDAIRRDALAIKDIRNQLDAYSTTFRADIKKEEDALRAADQELARKRTLLAPEQFAEERRKLEEQIVSVQRLVQARKQALDKARAEALQEVQKSLEVVVAKLAKENDIDLILRADQVVFRVPPLDITKNVLEALDKALPKVAVKIPKDG
ncbi:MAG: OmpH family outer membrane protein [Rhodobacterales bacterium]|nr:OmpH family outer membrane protein [Rhodobacterales bacterium]